MIHFLSSVCSTRHVRRTSRPFRRDFANEDLPFGRANVPARDAPGRSGRSWCWHTQPSWANVMWRLCLETHRQGASERSRKQFRQTVERIVHHLQPPDASQPSHSLFNIEGLQRCTTGRLPESKTGWWSTYPSEKNMKVSWDDDSQYMEKWKMFQTTNQQH